MTPDRLSLLKTLALTAAICAIGLDAVASDDEKDATKEVESQVTDAATPMQKGDMELAAIAGFGVAHDLWEGEPDVRFLALGVRCGRVLSGPRGPGFLRGNLEIAGELLPVFLVDPGDTTYGASVTLLGRHFFMPRSEWRPYAILGIGALATKDGIPLESNGFNFTLQAGMGVRFTYENKIAFYAEYRIHHISAGRTEAANPGVNSSYLQFSASVFRW